MEVLEITTFVVAGWLAGTECGSWTCVYPVIAKLGPDRETRFATQLF